GLVSAGVAAALGRRRLAAALARGLGSLAGFGREIRAGLRAGLAGDNRAHLLALAGVLAVALAARLWFVNLPLRYDEATTFIEYASRPLAVGLSYYSAPNNHLFHTLLVGLGTRLFGESEAAIRLPALLAGWLAVAAAYLVFRLIHHRRAGLMAAALAAGCPILVEFAVNARGYSLVTLLFLLLMALLAWLREHPHPAGWAVFAVLAALGLWSVPTMAYALTTAAVWWLLAPPLGWGWGRRLNPLAAGLAGAAGLTLLLYAPVLLGTGWRSLANASGAANPAPVFNLVWAFLRDALELTTRHWPAGAAWVLAGLGLWGALGHRRQQGRGAWWGWAALAGGLAVLLLLRSQPYPRIWLYLTPLILGAAGLGLARLMARVGESAFAATALVLAAGLGLFAVLSPAIPASDQGGALRDAAAIAEVMAARWRPGDAVLTACPADEPMAYQLRRRGLPVGAAFALLTGGLAPAKRIWVVSQPAGPTLADLLKNAGGQLKGCAPPQAVADFPEAALHLLTRQ
ncbi:MAG: glycosyltransferase family 39 protein, partial [Pseudomonadota bacterium]